MKRTTKRKIKKKVIALTKEILYILRDIAEAIPYPLETKYEYTRRLRNYQNYGVSRAFWELEKQGLVKKIKKEKKRVEYVLTDLGRAKSLKYVYGRKQKIERKDGLSTIVIFDISEEKKRVRDFLRRLLTQNGFTLFQESIFISRYKLLPEFREILSDLKIEHDVKILEGRIVLN